MKLSIKYIYILLFILVIKSFALTYTVKPGDSLDKIARKFHVAVNEIIKENQLNNHIIYPGQKLKIPEKKRYIIYRVKPGDTLSEIAQKFGVSIKEIVRANNLKRPYRLKVGQKLRIPKKVSKRKKEKIKAYRIYRVKKGDSLIKIAKKFGVSTKEIIKANNLRKPYRLKAGQKIKIPIKYSKRKTKRTSVRYTYSYCSLRYRVKPGDTLSEIAQKFRTSVKKLKKYNNLKSNKLKVGQILCVRKVVKSIERRGTTRVVRTRYIKYRVKPGDSLIKIARKFHVYTKDIIRANRLKKPYKIRVGQILKIPKKVVTYVDRREEELYTPSKNIKFGFIWPVDGKIINPFVNNSAMRHLGIDIQTSCGKNVVASEGGKVIYAGNSIKAFGNLIIIRHKGGFSTGYGHLGNILVKENQWVRKGQIIGTAGELNNGVCGIYFEIRKNTVPVDPTVFLPKK